MTIGLGLAEETAFFQQQRPARHHLWWRPSP